MWNTIANFKDNLTQIAADVLDSADELELDGSPHGEDDGSFDSHRPAPQRATNHSYKDPNLKAELEWYRGEVTRLQTAESEIQQLSMNYVALLKDREEELSRLQEENGLLKQKLLVSSSQDGAHVSEAEGRDGQLEKTIKNLEAEVEASKSLHEEHVAALQKDHQRQLELLTMQHRKELASAQSVRSTDRAETVNHSRSNGVLQAQDPQLQKLKSEVLKLQETEKKLLIQLVEKDEFMEKLRTSEAVALSEVKRMEEILIQEKEAVSQMNLQPQRDRDVSETALKEVDSLKLELQKASESMDELRRRLNEQESLRNAAVEELKIAVASLEKNNVELLEERSRLLGELEGLQKRSIENVSKDPAQRNVDASKEAATEVRSLTERLEAAEKSWASAKSDYETQLDKARSERDKATRDLARLKQHLLDKELADSEKMDQDSEQIADLQARADSNLARALHAEQALSQALSELSEAKRHSKEEYRRTSEEIEALQHKLSSCLAALESKDVELSNLQSALGQYYAETEAQERLYVELSASREEIATLSQQLQVASQKIEAKNAEKNSALDKLVYAEQRKFETEQKMRKLEEEVMRLRRALEQSMTRLNSLSSDSDYHVDRRIVIKLLVTYFQRNHNREVLDLMVRMLGFSEDDKRRVGLAQQNAGRGVVRGVLGLPGRFVGGLIGSASADSLSLPTPSENQSFADLWIDFLLKESEERERREKAEAYAKAEAEKAGDGYNIAFSNSKVSSPSEHLGYNSNASAKGSMSTPPSPERPVGHRPSNSFSGFSTGFSSPKGYPFTMDTSPSGLTNGPVLGSENNDAIGQEFSSISLTSSSSNSLFSLGHPNAKLPPRN
ncbi:hypothetical protein MPTK1_6g07280 [Marchantia polymorpha subsp. ruderalis]|uniref:GRIP domain-containing protein n=4 Tax=Marchantia polymorpha TaxID=3197 RepID=A0AAF6BPG4_MARPO|nr:hypothetical protein MARPO_0053s0042 [Marchantia polymorpha]BBN13898.1 hypothetical protein Mp_6g07280 [Marchantia polymorpha subsp. ruderalis]|eukprot:PTQ38100.1 hypothetical protein MARPO_0053s0042 [Marchantia polymorpha]